jgi:REP element-mobilizing transposase RayT
MTAPRQILPGTTYLVTRRCAQREFLLRPSAALGAIFLYVLALAARRYGVQVHAFCVLSNHFHLVVTDHDARLPAFAQYLGALVARAANVLLGRSESFWSPGSFSAVTLAAREDVVAKIVYVLANPVAAGLVPRGREWPGLWTAPERLGTSTLAALRPGGFFRKMGPLPETVELELTAPPAVGPIDAFQADVAAALDALERGVHRERGAPSEEPGVGGGFLGVARVLAQSPRDRARTWEPRGTLNPRVAARDKWKRIEVLTRLVDFLRAYRTAWRARRAGDPTVVFPAGTYLLRVAHGVRCAASA